MPRRRQGIGDRGHNGKGTQHPAVGVGERDGYAVSALRAVLRSRRASATAKAAAARTLAEIEGAIGRHSTPPVDKAQAARVSLLSRAELERELARLRTACAGDMRGDSA